MAMPKLRQPGRSRRASSEAMERPLAGAPGLCGGCRAVAPGCAREDRSLAGWIQMRVGHRLEGNARGFEDFAQDRFGLLGFLLRGDVARADYYAVGEDRHDQALEIVGQAIVAAFEESAGLRGAMEHHGAAGADAEAQLLGLARAFDDFERVIEQAFVHFHFARRIPAWRARRPRP